MYVANSPTETMRFAIQPARPGIHSATMKRLFFFGALLLILFEAANVYFIMPMPYSQRARSIDVAYFLYTWRWAFRSTFAALLVAGLLSAWRAPAWRKWLVPLALVLVGVVAYAANFQMAADHMFRAPRVVR